MENDGFPNEKNNLNDKGSDDHNSPLIIGGAQLALLI